MKFDYYILILIWITFPVVLWKVIPRERLRESIATFLFFQMLTWLFSIGLTYTGLLEAPVRLFKHATKINFTMEFLIFPTIAVLFQLNFPKKAYFTKRLLYYLLWVGIILSFMLLLGTFTNIMVVKWDNLIRSFFNFLIELWLCRRYVMWMTKHPEAKGVITS
ncbi:CBO0543 family protein [Bacillus sp. JJ1562]|uniref:CBO0543 family protein n=1 Tax=Bacillus sp. JJ1562 TaxID=3122960 RepID=UPI003001DE29